MVKIIVTKEFKNRVELDDFVRTRFGTDADKNAQHSIEAPAEELTALGLSSDTTIFGVRIVSTDDIVAEK